MVSKVCIPTQERGNEVKERTKRELVLMEDLVPHLHKLAQGLEISGLATYE